MTSTATASSQATRTETDTFGPIEVPANHYWGAQTQRSLGNFKIGGERMPLPLIHALGIVKKCAAKTNVALGQLDKSLADAAHLSGFADQSHMTRAFMRQFGITPGRYRAMIA